jgi:hypothetical protein
MNINDMMNKENRSLPSVTPVKQMTSKGSRSAQPLVSGWRGNAPAGKRALTIQEGDPMLYTIAVVLIILWLLGLVSGYTMGYFIHILLVIALVIILVRIIQGRRPL